MKKMQFVLKMSFLLISSILVLYAQPAHNLQELTTSGGDAVAMDKEWAVVGDVNNKSVHIYKLNYSKMHNAPMDMWELNTTISITANEDFGSAVGISGDYIVVGAPRNSGNAYIYGFNSNQWNTTPIATLNGLGNKDNLGQSVGITSDGVTAKIAVGAPGTNNADTSTGSVYTYNYDGNNLTSVITLIPDTQHDKTFGTSLDIKGDRLIVGAPESQLTTGEVVGAAYVYQYNGTTWEGFPNASFNRIKPGTIGESFGTHVAIDGNISLIATEAVGSSSSYIYTNDGSNWNETYEKQIQDGGDVDIDDDIYLISQRSIRLSFYDQTDGLSRPLTIQSDIFASKYTSVSLYKDQIIGNDPDNSQAIVYDIPCGIKPNKLKAFEWEMVSISCGDGSATIGDIFADDLGTYGPNANWVMYEQNGTDYTGTFASMRQMNENDPMELGKGYWIIADANQTWKVDDPVVTTRTPLVPTETVSPGSVDSVGGYYQYTLPSTGINNTKKIMVGNPFPRSFNLDQLQLGINIYFQFGTVVTFYEPTCYVYDTSQSGQPYRALSNITPGFDDKIAPYQGFWIKQNSSTEDVSGLKLAFPFEK